jgi:hypothetical protein
MPEEEVTWKIWALMDIDVIAETKIQWTTR